LLGLPGALCKNTGHFLNSGRSVARWLSPKPAKLRHEKLLDPAKNHVKNFQLK